MEGSQFYLTLPSNSSIDFYPQNTVSNFYVNPPQSIELTGQWEVSLKEIIYPRTWNNVRRKQNHFYIWGTHDIPSVFILHEGYYSAIEDVLQGIKNTNKMVQDNIELGYNRISRHVTVTPKNGFSIGFGDGLNLILGFGLKSPKISKETISPYVVNVEAGLHSLYIYSDVIEAQIVGDTMAPLLRIVQVEGKDGDIVSRTFQDPPYFPVSRKTFDSIEVDIKDDTGERVPFESGKVIVQLHFRERRPLYI